MSVRGCAGLVITTHLIAPQELVTMSVLEAVPDVQKLGNAVVPYVVGVLLGLVPCKRSSKIKETHRYSASLSLGFKTEVVIDE